jgi:hypothetical protein
MQLFPFGVKFFTLTFSPKYLFLQDFSAPHTTESQIHFPAAKRRDYETVSLSCQGFLASRHKRFVTFLAGGEL